MARRVGTMGARGKGPYILTGGLAPVIVLLHVLKYRTDKLDNKKMAKEFMK